jgi:hypothetical protein
VARNCVCEKKADFGKRRVMLLRPDVPLKRSHGHRPPAAFVSAFHWRARLFTR